MAKKNNNQVSAVRQAKHGWIWTLAFTVISILWIAPILVVLLNSFKRKAFIFRHPFTLGTEPLSAGWDKFIHGVERAFCGWLNYSNGIRKTNFWNSFRDFPVYYSRVGCIDYYLLLHVCMVYYQSPYKSDENNLCTVSVFHDCSIPDGNVYVIKICKPFTSVQSSWNYCCISGIWSGAGRFHVYRLCKGNFPGN